MAVTLQTVDSWSSVLADALWRACWQGGLFVGTVWLLCRAFPKIPIALRCWLWWLACLKLLITLVWPAGGVPVPILRPVSAKTPIVFAQSQSVSQPVSNAAPSPGAAVAQRSQAPPGLGARVDGVHKANRTNLTYYATAKPSGLRPIRLPSALKFAMLAWLIGIAGCLITAGKQLLGLRSLLRHAESLDETDLGTEVRALGIFFGLTGPPKVLSSESATAPFVVGITQPRVILPATLLKSLSAEERKMLVAHELAHVRRRDLWLSAVPLLAQAVFFFFPPAWVASRSWQTAQEAACDAEAMASTGSRPSEYADLLIQVASRDTRGRLIYALGATSAYYTLRDRLSILRNAGVVVGSILRPVSAFAGLIALAMVIPWNPTRQVEAAAFPSPVLRRQPEVLNIRSPTWGHLEDQKARLGRSTRLAKS